MHVLRLQLRQLLSLQLLAPLSLTPHNEHSPRTSAKAVYHELVEEDILVTRSAAGHAVRNPFETRRECTTTDWCVSAPALLLLCHTVQPLTALQRAVLLCPVARPLQSRCAAKECCFVTPRVDHCHNQSNACTRRFLDDGSGQRVRVEGSRSARLRHDALEMRQDYREKADGAGLQSLAQFFT